MSSQHICRGHDEEAAGGEAADRAGVRPLPGLRCPRHPLLPPRQPPLLPAPGQLAALPRHLGRHIHLSVHLLATPSLFQEIMSILPDQIYC